MQPYVTIALIISVFKKTRYTINGPPTPSFETRPVCTDFSPHNTWNRIHTPLEQASATKNCPKKGSVTFQCFANREMKLTDTNRC